ncbi:hypothetical protein LU676_31935, partial [Pseudomonas alloputida]|uniref:hypothetical protein n=1 Tax=Pseudomonas alloputida TaxID=1940621 RepID=UPI001E49649E
EAVEHLGQFSVGRTASTGSVFGQRQQARANKLTPEQQEAINQMKRFTDFNDLATKSSLGREALDRQVRSEVGLAIEKHQERIEQKRLEQVQTQAEKQQPRRAMSR